MQRKLVFIVFAFCLLFILSCSDSGEEDTVYETKNSGVERTRVENKTDNLIMFYENRVTLDQKSYINYNKLAESYIQKARESGDTAYYDKAEGALTKAIEIYPDNYAATVFMGQVKQSKHEFRQALDYAKKAVEMRPSESYAYGVLGDACIELGEYDDAQGAYEKMLGINPSLYSYSRISHIKELRGDTDGAIEAMKSSIEKGIEGKLPKENLAWARFILGDIYFNSGDLKKAEEQYEESLETYNNYYYALAGLARVKAARGKYEDAVELYKKAIAIVPLPQFISSLGDVYKKMGDVKEAQKQYDLVEYIGLLSTVNKVIYSREIALFYADRDIKLDESLQFAKRELEVRKDIYGYDALAWALYKNGRFKEAVDASRESLKLGTKDAKLFFHAGMIYYKLGEMENAKEHLKRALSINPYFHVIYSEAAENTLKDIEGKSSASKGE